MITEAIQNLVQECNIANGHLLEITLSKNAYDETERELAQAWGMSGVVGTFTIDNGTLKYMGALIKQRDVTVECPTCGHERVI